MSPTPLRLLAVLAFGVSLLSGCTPAPESTPTPSPAFTSDEEAFAAAEATFSAYTAATNRTDLREPTTFEEVYVWLTGDAATSARENYSRLQAEGITRSGDSTFDRMTLQEYKAGRVMANLCLDVSKVALIRPDGTSAVPADRPPRQPVDVVFAPAATGTGQAISSVVAAETFRCDD